MKRLDDILSGARRILVTGHVRPDGDCVGACLAVRAYAAAAVPEAQVDVCLEPFSPTFDFLKGSGDVIAAPEGEYDLALVLDASSFDRITESAVPAFRAADRTFCIDHHVTNTLFAQETHVEAEASSTCEVLFGLMREDLIDAEIARCLYLGIVHDTGVFKHSNTGERTMRIAGRLISLGAVPARIIDDTFYAKTFVQNRLLGRALVRAQLFCDGAIICSWISKEDLDREGAGSQDIEGIIDQLRVTQGTRIAVFLYELALNEWKVSLRANDTVDVAAVAAEFGGGGHVKAAGCSLSGSLNDCANTLLKRLAQEV